MTVYVPENTPPTPFLDPGAFSVKLQGLLNLETRSRLYFSFEGRGKARLFVNDELTLEASGDDLAGVESERLRLNPGQVPVRVEYEAPDSGSAEFRLYWKGREFRREVIPPTVWLVEPDDATAAAMQMREGRALFASLHCIKCHTADDVGGVKMPEAGYGAPSLAHVAATRNAAWVNAWLKGPRSIRKQARMPHLANGDYQTEDLTAWVMSQSAESSAAPIGGDRKAGARLFRDAGCVGCHQLPSDGGSEEDDRISLKWASVKFKPGELARFLKDPAKGNPHTRMPEFGFTDQEAADLASFVLSLAGGGGLTAVVPEGDATKGAKAAISLGCMNCHEPGSDSATSFPALKSIRSKDWLKQGCASGTRKDLPGYDLSDAEKSALAAFASKGAGSLQRVVAVEAAARIIEDLNCSACHVMDNRADGRSRYEEELMGLVAAVHEEKAEEGSDHHVDQTRPELTYAGEKLQAEWTRKLLNAELEYKPREWLAARMPAFRSRSELLATGMAHMHGLSAEPVAGTKVEAELAAIGKKLISSTGGFACNTCHAIGPDKATALFEVAGNNFAYVSDRLHYDYFQRWMHSPSRVDADTKMPQFIGADGSSPMIDVLEGSGEKQIDAIWQWMQLGEKIRAPALP